MDTLKMARFRKNLTQAELAKLVKTHHSQISMYESGKVSPYPAKRRKIEEALGGEPLDWSRRGRPLIPAGQRIKEEKRIRRGQIIQELQDLIPRLKTWLAKEEKRDA